MTTTVLDNFYSRSVTLIANSIMLSEKTSSNQCLNLCSAWAIAFHLKALSRRHCWTVVSFDWGLSLTEQAETSLGGSKNTDFLDLAVSTPIRGQMRMTVDQNIRFEAFSQSDDFWGFYESYSLSSKVQVVVVSQISLISLVISSVLLLQHLVLQALSANYDFSEG